MLYSPLPLAWQITVEFDFFFCLNFTNEGTLAVHLCFSEGKKTNKHVKVTFSIKQTFVLNCTMTSVDSSASNCGDDCLEFGISDSSSFHVALGGLTISKGVRASLF